MSRRFPRRFALALRHPVCLLGALLAAGVGACTRVVEQPPAPVVTPPPPPVRAAKSAPRPRPAWNSSQYGAGANAGPRAPAAAAPRAYAGPTPEEQEAAKVMTLQRDKLQKVLDDALPTLSSCWGTEAALSTNIAFEVTGAGKAENIRMPGAPEAAARCVTERLRGLPLPTYAGPVLSISIPVKVSHQIEGRPAGQGQPGQQPGQVAAAAASAPPPAPKLFVNP
jgi:hypothetical protein